MDVVLYTRRDCSLCQKAKETILASKVPMQLREIDIDADPALQRRYNDDVPVVLIDGMVAFRHRVDAQAFAMYVANRASRVSTPVAGRASVHGLAAEKCIPCRGGVPTLKGDELRALEQELGGGWTVVNEHHLEKEWTFPDFASALAFTNRVGTIAEEEGHHPDIHLAWGKVRLTIWTHKVDGLTRSDFVLAAKVDALPR